MPPETKSDFPSADFVRLFTARANAQGRMPFADFMRLALYDPLVGYYRTPRRRVGREAGTDFYTATSSGPVFGELVAAACLKLLGDRDPRQFTFVEIGAETPEGVLAGVDHPFGGIQTIQVGQPLALSGKCVVFSNELFDAQPFARFCYRHGKWHELGVAREENTFVEVELTARETVAHRIPLPATAPSGYIVDAPAEATALAESIAAQSWQGLFVAFDYGKSWRELIEATPRGTARAYFRHSQSSDLLANPGQQDLTCHVCWDWLVAALANHGFLAPQVETQEAFLIRHAERYIAPAIAADADRFTPRKQSLLQLLHGSHMGLKFQVLHALR
jgi:SAM-dependent MidA family methyltransferase